MLLDAMPSSQPFFLSRRADVLFSTDNSDMPPNNLRRIAMNEDKLQSPHHSKVRHGLRVGGPPIVAVGLLFMIIGIGSFFSSMGSFEPPRYFWCAFVGMPLLFIGLVMCQFGYLGAFLRYFSGESAPVAKDVANYMGENTQPGVKAAAKAAAEGFFEAQQQSKKAGEQS
jgi:hypothetical protein